MLINCPQKCLRTAVRLLFVSLLAAACASPPEPPPQVAADPEPNAEPVELNLNLPAGDEGCECVPREPGEVSDRTFLERGVEMLAAGDMIEAVQHFQRFQRMEPQPLAQWEARLAIAYVSMLPSSPYYDVQAASESYRALEREMPLGVPHESVVLMRQALETFVTLNRHIEDLEQRSSILEEDLEKREQALRRLRELTLGQPADAR